MREITLTGCVSCEGSRPLCVHNLVPACLFTCLHRISINYRKLLNYGMKEGPRWMNWMVVKCRNDASERILSDCNYLTELSYESCWKHETQSCPGVNVLRFGLQLASRLVQVLEGAVQLGNDVPRSLSATGIFVKTHEAARFLDNGEHGPES